MVDTSGYWCYIKGLQYQPTNLFFYKEQSTSPHLLLYGHDGGGADGEYGKVEGGGKGGRGERGVVEAAEWETETGEGWEEAVGGTGGKVKGVEGGGAEGAASVVEGGAEGDGGGGAEGPVWVRWRRRDSGKRSDTTLAKSLGISCRQLAGSSRNCKNIKKEKLSQCNSDKETWKKIDDDNNIWWYGTLYFNL